MAASTKRALAASLRKLLEHKTLDKITVRDITDDCQVNRQTFYYHFQDVYALLEWIFEDELAQVLGPEGTMDESSWKDTVIYMLHAMRENRSLIMNAYHAVNNQLLRRYLLNTIRPMLEASLRQLAVKNGLVISDANFTFLVNLYAFSTVGFLLDWVENNMRSDLEKSLDPFFRFAEGSALGAMKNLAEGSPAGMSASVSVPGSDSVKDESLLAQGYREV